jgi:hypothetical protein
VVTDDQWAKIGIFIRKSTLADLGLHESFGEAIFTLRDIYRVPVRRISREMVRGGEVIIRLADAAADALPGFVEFACSAAGLPPKSSPFLQVMRWVTGEFEVFHRSEAIYVSSSSSCTSTSSSMSLTRQHTPQLVCSRACLRLRVLRFCSEAGYGRSELQELPSVAVASVP